MRRPRASLAAGVLLAAGALLGGCGGAPTGGGARTAAELTNPRLSPERASWLVGAISRMATREEVEAYLAATDDAAAAALEEAFWERRDPDPARPGNPPRELFDRRSVDADRRFTEAGYRGRRSDRGTIFVLYGEPAEISFEINPHVGQTPIEVVLP